MCHTEVPPHVGWHAILGFRTCGWEAEGKAIIRAVAVAILDTCDAASAEA